MLIQTQVETILFPVGLKLTRKMKIHQLSFECIVKSPKQCLICFCQGQKNVEEECGGSA